MTVRVTLLVLALLMCRGISHGKDARWSNFAEDSDLRYYLDQKSVVRLPDNVFVFWVKTVAKDRAYLKGLYDMEELSYLLTSYELDCAVASYRIRGVSMFDKNRREINKVLPASDESLFEPVQPESMLELAQDEICVRAEGAAKSQPAGARTPVSAGAPPAPPATTAQVVQETVDPAVPVEPPSIQ